MAPSSSLLVPRDFSIVSSSLSIFSLCLLYFLFDHLYRILAVNLSSSSLENIFLFSFSSYCCTSSASSLYSLSNSLTNSFAFFRFSLLSQVSPSTVYPFYHTKNISFSLTTLLFSIFSTLNSSSPLAITGFGRVFLYSSI